MLDCRYSHVDDLEDEFEEPIEKDFRLEKRRKFLRQLSSRAIGDIGENEVKDDILLHGFDIATPSGGAATDVYLDMNGKNTVRGKSLLRIQVKCCAVPKIRNIEWKGISFNRSVSYAFATGTRAGEGKRSVRGTKLPKRLTKEHCDIIALVAADIRTVDYFHVDEDLGVTTCLYLSGSKVRVVGQYPLERLLDHPLDLGAPNDE